MPKNDDRLDLRDADLRARTDDLIRRMAKAGKKITRSELLRAAVAQFLNKIEEEGRIVIELPRDDRKR
jgi:hypothetical protein